MGKIYFNINDKKIGFFEEENISSEYILFKDMAGKIILKSINGYRDFPSFDPHKKNLTVIKKLIQTGYKALTKHMELLLTQNYSICPNCGKDIDVEQKTNVLILDSGFALKNIVYNNLYPAKNIICDDCSHEAVYYYDIYSSKEDRKAFIRRSVIANTTMLVKYNYIIPSSDKKAYIPLSFDLNQFNKLFIASKTVAGSDMEKTILNSKDSKIIDMLFNEEILRYMEKEEGSLSKNIKLELNPIEFGIFEKYNDRKDFDELKQYIEIGNNKDNLRELMKGE